MSSQEKDSLMEVIRRIAMVVGHELRNPLAVINNSAYFLKRKLGSEGRLDPKVEKHLGIVTEEIARVDRMITDILSTSRPIAVKPEPYALNDFVKEALKAWPPPKGVALARKLCRENPQVALDPHVLEAALVRILDNAGEAAAGAGTVTVETAVDGGKTWLEVRDTGPGIKPEALPFVFQPFFTTKPRGLGLGLSLARKSVEAMGAKIEAKNPSGGGAAVRIFWKKGGPGPS